MKRILKWLETKFSRRSTVVEADEHQSPGRVQSHEPGKDIPMPHNYASADTSTQQHLRIPDESSLDASESTGVGPYNTGSFDTSTSRESPSRK